MTNETDRELLELAAKAAGLNNLIFNHGQTNAYHAGSLKYMTEKNHHTPWNPLNDDGDRYRLARHLGLCINFTECTVWKRLPDHSLVQEYWGGDCGDEAHAIVRAAAEIGKTMK